MRQKKDSLPQIAKIRTRLINTTFSQREIAKRMSKTVYLNMAYSVTVTRRNHLRKRKIADNLSNEQLKGNGKIDFPEFICLMEKMTKPMEEQASTLEAYRVFDDDGAGFINSKCLRESLIRSLDQLSPSEINDLLDFSGLVQDRQINYEEFVRLVIPNSLLNLSSGGCKINLLEMSSRLNSPSFSKEEKDDKK
ncbi:uncharacterized protein LOC100209403 isoform X5 [Hydra vulgaris]|uniref:uncharacterized protein LOC100209403 isoform X5 n=1 Tax=Hydra vulgaris TaxID=6087 RepID=UPI0032EA7DA6